jgi:ABC-type branched-subunit amino acid transport system ATPase component
MPADLVLRDISVALGGVRILSEVSMHAEAGETFGIIGPNGAGKTTVLNVISGVVPVRDGTVEVGGENLAGKRPHRLRELGIGRSLQTTQFFRDLTALELVALSTAPNGFLAAARMRGHRGDEGPAMEALERLENGHIAHDRLGELPSGVQKLVDLARAILGGPSLLLLDEPTSGVSAEERQLIRSTLDDLRAEGRTIMVIDHDPGFVASCCDRVACMNFGTVLVTGTPDEVLASDEVRRSYLGDID